jgi:hypothetical protein
MATTMTHFESLESTMSFRSLVTDGLRRHPPADRPEDEVAAVMRRVRRVVGLVMPSNHVDLHDGQPLWLHPDLAAPGAVVCVLRYGDELAVWTTGAHPTLLVAHQPATADTRAVSFPWPSGAQPSVASERVAPVSTVAARPWRRAS